MKRSDLEPEFTNEYHEMLLEAPVATAVYLGKNMLVQFANAEMLKLWGKDEAVLGKTLREALPELEGQPFHDLLDQVYTTGVPYQTEEGRAELNVNGHLQPFYFNFTYKPLRNSSGEIYGVLNMAVDVTSHVKVKQQLRQAEERMEFALDSAGIGTWELLADEKHILWDSRCRQMFGMDAADTVHFEDLLKRIHPDDVSILSDTLSGAFRNPNGGGTFDINFRVITEEAGRVRFLRTKGKASFDSDGKATRFAGIFLDVSREKAMDAEQHKLLTLVDNSAELMSILGSTGKNLYINKSGMELLGFDSVDQVYTTPISELHAPEDYAQVQMEVLPAVHKQGKWSGKIYVRHLKTGEVFPVFNQSIRINDPATGDTVAVGAVMRDLRPEIKAQEALTRSEQLLRSITTASPAALWMTDENGYITYLNQTWVNWTGLGLEENLNSGWAQALVEEDRQRVIRTFLVDLHHRRDSEIEFRVQTADGIKWCISSGKPQFDENGRFLGYIGSCTDVSELKMFEQRMRESANKLVSILEGLPQIAFTATVRGSIDYFTQKWYTYTGLDAELSLSDPTAAIAESSKAITIRKWREAISAGREFLQELQLRNKDGAERWHLAAALPIKNYDGETVSWVGTLTDIHEQKELQRQKDDFLGIASHELKTPVTSIKAYTQILESMLRKSGDEKKADMVLKMDSQVNRLTNLIGDLLDVTKIQTGKMSFSREWFDFNLMVQEILEDLQRTTSKHTIVEEFGETGSIYADRYRMGQVITNLVSNAIKYSPNADKIIVSTKRKGDKVSCAVRDFGIGISPEKKDRVFEQFYRVSGDMEFTFSGLGLGLYISSQIIQREGGTIWVESEEGKGSTFCFTIPANNEVGPEKSSKHL